MDRLMIGLLRRSADFETLALHVPTLAGGAFITIFESAEELRSFIVSRKEPRVRFSMTPSTQDYDPKSECLISTISREMVREHLPEAEPDLANFSVLGAFPWLLSVGDRLALISVQM